LVFAVIARSQFFESSTELYSMYYWTRRRRRRGRRSSLWNKCFSDPDCIVMRTFIFFFKEEDAIDIRRMILSGCTTRVLYIDGAYLEYGELAL
jgi:hypothetical protein